MNSRPSARPSSALSRLRRALPLLTLLALGVGLLCSGQAQAQSFEVQALSQNGASAYALNARGQISGTQPDNSGVYQAFLSGPNGQGMVNLNNLVSAGGGLYLNDV